MPCTPTWFPSCAAAAAAAAGNLGDHGADVAAAVLDRLSANGSSSSSNGSSGAASNGSSNGNGAGAIAAAVDALPAQLVPAGEAAAAAAGAAEPGACIASADGSWARNIIINGDDHNVLGPGVVAVTPDGRKLRHPVRPPVVHRHGCGPLQPSEPPVPPVSIFRHPLLQHFMLTVFCKLPVVSLSSMGDLKYSFMVRLILSSFQFRINQRWVGMCVFLLLLMLNVYSMANLADGDLKYSFMVWLILSAFQFRINQRWVGDVCFVTAFYVYSMFKACRW
jgi:hypothetical protein